MKAFLTPSTNFFFFSKRVYFLGITYVTVAYAVKRFFGLP